MLADGRQIAQIAAMAGVALSHRQLETITQRTQVALYPFTTGDTTYFTNDRWFADSFQKLTQDPKGKLKWQDYEFSYGVFVYQPPTDTQPKAKYFKFLRDPNAAANEVGIMRHSLTQQGVSTDRVRTLIPETTSISIGGQNIHIVEVPEFQGTLRDLLDAVEITNDPKLLAAARKFTVQTFLNIRSNDSTAFKNFDPNKSNIGLIDIDGQIHVIQYDVTPGGGIANFSPQTLHETTNSCLADMFSRVGIDVTNTSQQEEIIKLIRNHNELSLHATGLTDDAIRAGLSQIGRELDYIDLEIIRQINKTLDAADTIKQEAAAASLLKQFFTAAGRFALGASRTLDAYSWIYPILEVQQEMQNIGALIKRPDSKTDATPFQPHLLASGDSVQLNVLYDSTQELKRRMLDDIVAWGSLPPPQLQVTPNPAKDYLRTKYLEILNIASVFGLDDQHIQPLIDDLIQDDNIALAAPLYYYLQEFFGYNPVQQTLDIPLTYTSLRIAQPDGTIADTLIWRHTLPDSTTIGLFVDTKTSSGWQRSIHPDQLNANFMYDTVIVRFDIDENSQTSKQMQLSFTSPFLQPSAGQTPESVPIPDGSLGMTITISDIDKITADTPTFELTCSLGTLPIAATGWPKPETLSYHQAVAKP